jgi:DNA polymerase-3 subunit epsilon
MAMTRGQESLVMLNDDDALSADNAPAIDVSRLVVRRASEAELAAHQVILSDIDRASGGKTIWPREAQG